MKPPLSYVPLLPAAVGLTAGVVVCLIWTGSVMACFGIRLPHGMMTSTLICAVFFLVLGILATLMKQWWLKTLFFGGCLGAAICTGYQPLGEAVEGYWTGRVIETKVKDSSVTLMVEIDGEMKDGVKTRLSPLKTRVVVVTVEELGVESGDRVVFYGQLSPLSTERDLPYRESERDYLLRMGVGAKATLFTADSLTVEKSKGMTAMFNSLRTKSKTRLLRSSLKPSTKEFMTAIVLGDREILPDKAKEDFARTGLSHMLALSGLHIGLLAGLLAYLLFPLRLLGISRRWSGIGVCLILWGYAMTTGMSPTVVRAVIMATVVIVSKLSGKMYNPYNAMLLAWILLVVTDPFNIFNIGFILSFTAILSVVMFSAVLSPWQRRGWPLRSIGQTVGASLSAVMGTGLVTCAVFNRFSLSFLVSNVVVMPLLPFVLGGGFCLTFFLLLGWEARWLCWIIDKAFSIIEGVTSWIASFGSTVIEDVYFPLWLAFMWIGVLLVWGRWIGTRSKSTWLGAIILSSGCIGAMIIEAQPDQRLAATVYLLRDTEHTTIMLHNMNRIDMISTLPEREYENYLKEFRRANKEFIYRQRVDSISLHGPRLLTARGKRILLVDNCRKVRKMDNRVDYAVLGRNFTGSMGALLDSISIENVILSHRLPRRRAETILKECLERGIGCSSLKEEGASIILDGES